MADGGGQDVLGLKARAAQRAFEARGMSPAKALRRALSRSADLLWGLAVVSQGVQIEELDQDGVIETIDPGMLLLIIDGPDGAVGLVMLDREVLTGLIEVQTIQQVTTVPVEDRPLTATDGAMAAPLVDAALGRFAANLDDHPLAPQIADFRFGAMIEDARAVSLILDAAGYHAFEIRLDLALGRRKGIMRFIFPKRVIRPPEPSRDLDEDGQGPHEASMELLPVRLDSVLARLRVPLSRVQTLKEGDLLDLPGNVTDGLLLVAGGDQVVARGRLGQLNGMRAIRLTWPQGSGLASSGGAALDGAPMDDFDAKTPPQGDDLSDASASGALADLSAAPESDVSDAPADLPDLDADTAGDAAEPLGELPSLGNEDLSDFDFSAAPMDEADGTDFDVSTADFDFDTNG